MVTTTRSSPSASKKSRGRGGKKKLTEFNKFMQTEMPKVKESHPEIPHRERFKLVVENWNKKKEQDSKKEAAASR